MDCIFGLNSRITLFSGHYGSGKSEVAVNYAIMLSRSHRAAIVDFDIINTYFRSAGARGELERMGIRVIAPIYANTNVDVPALPAEISSLFDDRGVAAVFDVGGDSAGARAVSRYREEFLAEKPAHCFVFNVRRPSTSTIGGLTDAFHEIQNTARLPFTAIVNNTNVLSETEDTDLLEGLDMAVELSGSLGLPLAFNSYIYKSPAFLSKAQKFGLPVFEMKKFISMDYK